MTKYGQSAKLIHRQWDTFKTREIMVYPLLDQPTVTKAELYLKKHTIKQN